MANIPSKELTEKFIKGLKEYNLTTKDIEEQGWKYCGGNRGRHKNYFHLFWGKEYELPEHTNKCVCNHSIEENCYITNGNKEGVLILGNCCIKKFIPKSGRTCEICDEPHRNRVVNRCNDCRMGMCDDCDGPCDDCYKKCTSCHFR